MTPTTFSEAIDRQDEQISDINQEEVGSSETKTVQKLLWNYLRKGDLETVSQIFEGAFAKISDDSAASEVSQPENPHSTTDDEGDLSGEARKKFNIEQTNKEHYWNSERILRHCS